MTRALTGVRPSSRATASAGLSAKNPRTSTERSRSGSRSRHPEASPHRGLAAREDPPPRVCRRRCAAVPRVWPFRVSSPARPCGTSRARTKRACRAHELAGAQPLQCHQEHLLHEIVRRMRISQMPQAVEAHARREASIELGFGFAYRRAARPPQSPARVRHRQVAGRAHACPRLRA